MFVDVDDAVTDVDDLVSAFQQIPHRLGSTSYLLLRWPAVTVVDPDSDEDREHDRLVDSWLGRLDEEEAALGISQRYTGIVRFRVGAPPRVRWAAGQSPHGQVSDRQLLARAAAVEIATLLDWGKAVGLPDTYHYELPSGKHAAGFIRVANAVRSPRDSLVLASWLVETLRDGSGMLLDTGTLTPVVVQLQALQRARGWGAGPVEMLDSYPRTRLDAGRAARRLRTSHGGALGLLSVSSSGAVRDLMATALGDATPTDSTWSMVVLVDRDHPTDSSLLTGQPGEIATLLGLDDGTLDSTLASVCPLCKNNKRAPLVRVDPSSFDPHVLPEPDLVMPDTKDGRANARLWDACERTGAIGVEALPHESASRSRPKGQLLGIRIHFEDLLCQEPFAAALNDRLADLRSNEPSDVDSYSLEDLAACDAVMVTPEDRQLPGFKEVWKVLRPALGIADATPIVELPAGSEAGAFEDKSCVLVLTLGTVTGWTMRQQLLALANTWRGEHDRKFYGLIVHARPPTLREWENLQNSYSKRLRAIWLTFLPWRSPLDEEHRALEELRASGVPLSPEGVDFLRERRYYCRPRVHDWRERTRAPGAENARSVLWGMAPRGGAGIVRNQSIYGWQISAMTAYVAVGAAMHSRRTERSGNAARWRVFEMPAVARSYYDAILVACVLRWLQPDEGWWGRGSGPQNAVKEMIGKTTDEAELRILLPELLLAAAQGKMPREAAQEAVDQASGLSGRWPRADQAPIEVGLALVKLSLGIVPG